MPAKKRFFDFYDYLDTRTFFLLYRFYQITIQCMGYIFLKHYERFPHVKY